MGWRPEERSSSDVGQWTTLLRRLLGHFAISTTSVECYGLSHACFYLRLSSNVTTRVWIDTLYHIKPGKYHGVGTFNHRQASELSRNQNNIIILKKHTFYNSKQKIGSGDSAIVTKSVFACVMCNCAFMNALISECNVCTIKLTCKIIMNVYRNRFHDLMIIPNFKRNHNRK